MLNWPYEMMELAIDMHIVENSTPLDVGMELSNDVELHNLDHEHSCEPNLDNFELTCDAVGKVPLCHSMHSFIKETSKYENHVTEETKLHISQTLTNLLGTVVNRTSTILNDVSSDHEGNVQHPNPKLQTEVLLKSLCPDHDKRKRDKRLKSFWEV